MGGWCCTRSELEREAILTMRNLPEQRKGSAGKIASSFCSAVEFLSDAKIGGCTVGILLFFAALIAAMTAHYYFDTFLFVYLLIIVAFAGQVAHILICKREGLRDYLLTTGLRLAGLGAGWWDCQHLFRLRLFLDRFSHYDWGIRRGRSACPDPQMVSPGITLSPRSWYAPRWGQRSNVRSH